MEIKFIAQVAAEYLAAKHEPDHESYKAFCRETVSQFRGLVNSGWYVNIGDATPYKTSNAMFLDMKKKHLLVGNGGKLIAGNPMAAQKCVTIPCGFVHCYQMNEMFRAVHDILGHCPNRSPYETFEGELEAYQEHKKWYSPEAIPALYSETIGQLCVYYSTGDFVPVQENKIIEVRL